MANSDKNISIIPNKSLTGQPQIIFTGQGNDPITLKVLDSTIGSLSFEGSAGQLLSITDSLSSGSIFSVNDISGMPSIDVNADGTVALAPFSGNIAIGVTSASFKLHVNGTLYTASAATFNSNVILSNGNLQTTTSTFNLITNTASTINIGTTSGSTISIASTTGTTTVNNSAIITGNLTVNGGTITSTATTFNLLNTTVTNANVLGAADTILIGSAGGSTTIRNAATRVNGTLTVTGVSVHQGAGAFNSTLSVTGTSTLIGDVTASGDIAVNGGDITSTSTTFNLLNATVTGLNVGGAANTVVLGGTGGTTTIRNAGTNINGTLTVTGVSVHQGAGTFNSTLTVTGATVVQGALSANGALSVTGTSTLIGDVTASGDLAVNGGDITSTATTFNLLNTTVTGLNVGGAANTVVLGGTGGTSTIRNAGTNINGTLTVTGVSVHQGAGAFNSTLTVTGVTTLQGASTLQSAVNMNSTLTVTGVSVHQGAGAFNSTLSVTGTSTLIGDVTASGDIAVNGGDITSTATTFNLLNATVTNANVLGAANIVVIGGTGGAATIRNAGTNINGTLTVTGVSVHQGAGAFNSTLTVTGVTTLQGASTLQGAVNMNSTLTVTGVSVHQGAGTFNSTLSVTGVTTLQGASTLQGAVNMNSTLTVTGVSVHQGAGAFNSTLSVTGTSTLIGDVTASGDIAVNGGDITSTATTFNLLNTTVTNANVLGAANIVVIGGTGGAATIRNAGTNINGTLTVTGASTFIGDIIVRSGDIETTSSVFTFVTNTASTINIGTISGSTIAIGNASGTTTIRNAGTNLNGTLTVTGATVIQGALSSNSTLSVTSNAIFVGSILANGGTITSTATTFNLLNTTVTNANVLGAATIVVIGANSSGSALIRNSNILLGGTVTGTTTISTTTGTAAHLTISPQGNLTLSPLGSIGAGGIRPSVTVPNNSAGTGTISISGAYVLIGNRNDGSDYSGEIRIQEQSGNDYFGLKAPDTMAASTTYTLPSAFPASSGFILNSTTTGLMTWAAPAPSANVVVTATSASSNYKLVFTDVNATNTSASLLIDTTSGIVYNPSTDALIVNGPLSANSTLSVTGDATFAGSVIANGGTITSSATTFNLLNTTVTNANVLGAANAILIGSISGTTTIRNAGTNINGNLTVSGSSSFGAAVDHTFGLSNRGVLINAGKGTSEILSYGNETLAVSGMGGNGSLELFGGYVTVGDDGNNDGTQIVLADNAGGTIAYNASGGHIFYGTGSFNGLLTASAGISVSGATAAIFNGTVSCNSSTIYKPTLQYYNEVLASPTISANVLTLDLSTAQMFTVSLNANITTFTISNTPATANRSIGFTLIFTADGTARTVTWGAAVKWANNDPPALTSTNGKKDILSFVSPDGGTNWYGFIGGLNF